MTIRVWVDKRVKPTIYEDCSYYIGMHAKEEVSANVFLNKFCGENLLTITRTIGDKPVTVAVYSGGTNWYFDIV